MRSGAFVKIFIIIMLSCVNNHQFNVNYYYFVIFMVYIKILLLTNGVPLRISSRVSNLKPSRRSSYKSSIVDPV